VRPVWVIGNGGHAKVVIDALRLQRSCQVAGIISDDPAAPPVEPGLLHIGPVSPDVLRRHGVDRAIIAIGANSVRARIAAELDDAVEWVSAIHPSAIVSPTATIGTGILLAAGSIVQPSVAVGDHAIINTGASVDHDSVIGACAHIAPGAHLAGNVMVGEGTLVGVGASVIPGITIGTNAIIGAGSVVIRDIPDNARVVGNPARPIN